MKDNKIILMYGVTGIFSELSEGFKEIIQMMRNKINDLGSVISSICYGFLIFRRRQKYPIPDFLLWILVVKPINPETSFE